MNALAWKIKGLLIRIRNAKITLVRNLFLEWLRDEVNQAASADLTAIYENRKNYLDVRQVAWDELYKRWQEQTKPITSKWSYSLRIYVDSYPSYYGYELHFMPRPN